MRSCLPWLAMASSEDQMAGQTLTQCPHTCSIASRQTGRLNGAANRFSQSVHCAPSRPDRPDKWQRHGLVVRQPPPGGWSPSACRTHAETFSNNTLPVHWLGGMASVNLVHGVHHERLSKCCSHPQLLQNRPAALVQPICPRDLVHHLMGITSGRAVSGRPCVGVSMRERRKSRRIGEGRVGLESNRNAYCLLNDACEVFSASHCRVTWLRRPKSRVTWLRRRTAKFGPAPYHLSGCNSRTTSIS